MGHCSMSIVSGKRSLEKESGLGIDIRHSGTRTSPSESASKHVLEDSMSASFESKAIDQLVDMGASEIEPAGRFADVPIGFP